MRMKRRTRPPLRLYKSDLPQTCTALATLSRGLRAHHFDFKLLKTSEKEVETTLGHSLKLSTVDKLFGKW